MEHTKVTTNDAEQLFVIPEGKGITCLGYDICETRANGLAAELETLGDTIPAAEARGTVARYDQYRQFVAMAAAHNKRTGWRSAVELTPQLIGLEGQRVEVVDSFGETRRFLVGKSTRWTPCHLELFNRISSGGPGVSGAPFKSIRVVS